MMIPLGAHLVNNSPREISQSHADELRDSGLSNDTLQTANVHTETDSATIAKLLNRKNAANLGECLVFPFFDADGNPDAYAMVKPKNPRINKKTGKPLKYELPKGKPNRAYITPSIRAALADVNTPVFITEGCKKTLAAIQYGYACIGLSGVWNWCVKRKVDAHGKKRGPWELIPDLAVMVWRGRTVYIVFDSDATTNSHVQLAEKKVASVLRAAGAIVKIVRLPAEANGAKNGLDDYLVRHGKDAFTGLVAVAQAPTEDATDEKQKPPSVCEALVSIGLTYDLWHDATQTAFATSGRDTRAVKSKGFKQRLRQEYFNQTRKPPNAEALANAIDTLEGHAVCAGAERTAHVRIAGYEGRIYIHLANDRNTVIEIDANGWRECERPPVYFRKPSGMNALPMPQRGGSLDELRRFINCPDDSAFALVKAWLSGCFQPQGPFPLLVATGEKGSAKSTTCRVLKKLIDPCAAPLRSEPKDTRDLAISAESARVLGFDNFSHLPTCLSDSLCQLSTGGGFSYRALYTDDEQKIFDAKRPMIMNGIENFVTRGDLLERSILLNHPTISEENRKPESELWAGFDSEHPKLLGALLDRISAGLKELLCVKLDRLPRMADFAKFAVACERGANEIPLFLPAYLANQSGACEQALESSPVPAALVKFMQNRDRWEGTPSDIYEALTEHTNKPDAKDWPKAANTLSGKLTRLAPDLRTVHRLNVETTRGTKGKRAVIITRLSVQSETSSTPARSNDDCDDVVTLPNLANRHPQNAGETTENTASGDFGDDVDDDSRLLSGRGDDADDPYGTTTDFSAQAM